MFTKFSSTNKKQIRAESPSSPVKEFACGGFATFFLLEDQSVHACGPFTNPSKPPTIISDIPPIQSLLQPKYFGCFLIANEQQAWECNGYYIREKPTVEQVDDFDINEVIKIQGENKEQLHSIFGFEKSNQIKQLASGDSHLLMLDTAGIVWGVGSNLEGQLGLGELKGVSKPLPIQPLPPIEKIGAGEEFSVFLGKNGQIWTCGINQSGQLGLGAEGDYYEQTPKLVTNIPKIINIAVGITHVILEGEDGSLWGFGDNQSGQLALGDTKPRKKPTQITYFHNNLTEEITKGDAKLSTV